MMKIGRIGWKFSHPKESGRRSDAKAAFPFFFPAAVGYSAGATGLPSSGKDPSVK